MLPFSIKLVTDIGRFVEIRELWKALVDADDLASLFTTYEWAENWIAQYWEAGYRLHLVILQRESVPVGILPLYFNAARRAYYFIGTGEPEEAEVSSEYVDYLVGGMPERLDDTYRFVAAHLESLGQRLEVPNVVPDSHLYRTLHHARRVIRSPTGRQYRLVVKDFDSLLAALSRKERKKAQQSMNRFARLSALDFQLLQDGAEQNELWEELRSLHQADWQSRGKLGAFHDDRFARFHLGMRKALPDIQQWYALLRHEGRLIAINHYYRHKDTLYFYLTGSIKEEHGRLSPGIMLHLLALSQLSGSGLIYDFLKGGMEDSYKSRLCAPGGYFFTLRHYPPTLAGRVLFLINKAKVRLREWRVRLHGLQSAEKR